MNEEKFVLLPKDLVDGLMNYLGTKPFAEVINVINAMQVKSRIFTTEQLMEVGFLKKTEEEENES